jgi:hypothetical protein
VDLRQEVADWLGDNVHPDEWEFHEVLGVVCFDRMEDALAFKLRWR